MENRIKQLRNKKTAILVYDKDFNPIIAENINESFGTASIIKAAVACYLIEHRIPGESDSIEKMVKQSDNDATSYLWKKYELEKKLPVWFASLDMHETHVGKDGYWGLTTTTAWDQMLLWKHIIGLNHSFLNQCFENVVPSQKWGVSSGVPREFTSYLKNGWSPKERRNWRINTCGWIQKEEEIFGMVLLSEDHLTYRLGMRSVNRKIAKVWEDVLETSKRNVIYL